MLKIFLAKVWFLGVGLFLVMSFWPISTKAFDTYGVHPALSRAVAYAYNDRHPDNNLDATAIAWLAHGSSREDIPVSRPLNHFFNPLSKKGLSILGISLGWPSPFWASSPSRQRLEPITGDCSWPTARRALRDNNLAKAHTCLGHVLHLLQDSAVPAHVRNDQHVEGDPFEQWLKFNRPPMKEPLPSLPDCSDYRDCIASLATWVNRRFFSKDTIDGSDFREPFNRITVRGDILFDGSRPLARYNIRTDELILTEDIHEAYWHEISPMMISYGVRLLELFFDNVGSEPPTPGEIINETINDAVNETVNRGREAVGEAIERITQPGNNFIPLPIIPGLVEGAIALLPDPARQAVDGLIGNINIPSQPWWPSLPNIGPGGSGSGNSSSEEEDSEQEGGNEEDNGGGQGSEEGNGVEEENGDEEKQGEDNEQVDEVEEEEIVYNGPPESPKLGSLLITAYGTGLDGGEYLEIYNQSNKPISLSGLAVQAKRLNLSSWNTLASGASLNYVILEPHSFFLIAGPGYSENFVVADRYYVSPVIPNTAGELRLFYNNTVIDHLSYDEPTVFSQEPKANHLLGSRTVDLNRGLKRLWHFSECVGEPRDSLIEDVLPDTLWAVGKWDCALEYNYYEQKTSTTIPLTLNSPELTFSFYSKDVNGIAQNGFYFFDENEEVLAGTHFSGHNVLYIHNGSWPSIGRLYPENRDWHLMTFVFGHNYIAWYLNGQLVKKYPLSGALSGEIVKMTMNMYGGVGAWLVDEIGIWDRALAKEEVAALFNQQIPPVVEQPSFKPAKLLHYWDFEDSGTLAVDKVGGVIIPQAALTTGRYSQGLLMVQGVHNYDISIPSLNSRSVSLSFWRHSMPGFSGQGGVSLYSSLLDGHFGLQGGYGNIYAKINNYAFFLNRPLAYYAWIHMGLVYDAQEMTLTVYFNGQPYIDYLVVWPWLPLDRLFIYETWDRFAIDDLRIYEGVLTPEQILELAGN